MNKRTLRLIPLAVLAVALIAAAGDADFTLPPENNTLKPGPGSDLVTAQCLLCHSADYIGIQPRFARAVWKAEVVKMQQKYGAPIATNNIDGLVDYLTANYGKEDAAPKAK